MRGDSWAPKAGTGWGEPLRRHMRDGVFLVASYVDAQKLGRPYILLEHGAGACYPNDPRSAGHPSYSGGVGHDRCVLFVCPSEAVVIRWRAVYPDTPAVAVGCPMLDEFHNRLRAGSERQSGLPSRRGDPSARSRPTVAVTFHWDSPEGTWIPETRSALAHFRSALPALRDAVREMGGTLLGHGHPRAYGGLRRVWNDLGIPHTPDWSYVLDNADLLVVDNSSAGPEAASVGIPLLWLWAPWWRRGVSVGREMWAAGQVEVSEPSELVEGMRLALADPPEVRAAREAMVAEVYVACDGRAGERAARAIVDCC